MDETNAHYGGFNQRGSNIFWTNGGIDPWHAMSVIESDNQDVVYIPVYINVLYFIDCFSLCSIICRKQFRSRKYKDGTLFD